MTDMIQTQRSYSSNAKVIQTVDEMLQERQYQALILRGGGSHEYHRCLEQCVERPDRRLTRGGRCFGNLANALTEGYGTRSLSLSSQTLSASGGVRVNGIVRDVDQALVGQRREAAARNAESETQTTHLASLETLIGTPDNSASLAAKIAEFEATLISAASQPGSSLRLSRWRGAAVI